MMIKKSVFWIAHLPSSLRLEKLSVSLLTQRSNNGLLSLVKHISFPSGQQIHCKDSSATAVTFNNYEKVEAYTAMKIHPGDLKDASAICLQNLLKPIRTQC